jgi:pimeloyl-ACP methyl ester carboxylesterase
LIKRILKVVLVVIAIAAVAFVVFWFSRPADLVFTEARASLPNSDYSHFAEIDGVRIHYQEKGSGTPLVLLHGFSSSTYSWKDVFEPLAKNFRVVVVDLKGFGFSAKPDGDYSRRAQAVLVTHLLDHLQIKQAWLVGNSVGGEVALNVVLQNPTRVAGLILIDSAGVQVPGHQSVAPAYLRIPVLGRVLLALALSSDKLVRQGLLKSFYDDAKVTDERVAAYYRPLKTRNGQLAAARTQAQFGEFPIEQDLARINTRTLIIWGAEDQLIPLAAGHKLNDLIKDSKLVTIERCGHVPQEELPERVVAELSRFVADSQGPNKNLSEQRFRKTHTE